MSSKLLIDHDKLREILERKLKGKILTSKTTIPKIVNSLMMECGKFPYHPPAKSEITLTTISLCVSDFNQIGNNILAYVSDGSGFGYGAAVPKIKEMFNNNSDDWRTMPRLYDLEWMVEVQSDKINLSLERISIQYGEEIKPKPYWIKGGRQEPDTENYCWVPLHGGYGSVTMGYKNGIIPTPVLGVHFNFAVKWFEEHIGKNVFASYPVDIVNDIDGSYDTCRV